jgi:uncharacterized repeat protein (TIGR01451 family)
MKIFGKRPRAARKWLVAVSLCLAVLAFTAVGSAAPAGSTDLAISKSDGPDPARVGSVLTYSIAVQNLGPQAASGATVTDSLPKEVDFVSASATGGKCSLRARRVSCELGPIPFGGIDYSGGAAVAIAVIPRRPGTIVNTATVKAEQKDPVAANDSASATTRVLDVARCLGVAATLTGTAGDDVLSGSGGPDVIVALGGADTIRTGAGRDLVCAGSGADLIVGGSAADRLLGGAGADRVLGRGGPDLLRAGSGNDLLRGGTGADRLRGGRGSDRCLGGPGRNSIRGCER